MKMRYTSICGGEEGRTRVVYRNILSSSATRVITCLDLRVL